MPGIINPFDPTRVSSGTFSSGLAGCGSLLLFNLSLANITLTTQDNKQYNLPAISARRIDLTAPSPTINWKWASSPGTINSNYVYGEWYLPTEASKIPETYPVAGIGGALNIQQISGVVSISAQTTFITQMTINSNGTLTVTNVTLPTNTSAIYITSNNVVNNYGVKIQDHILGTTLYNEPPRPQGQTGIAPIIPTNNNYDITITNLGVTTIIVSLYAVVGALPTLIEPLEGFIRTTGEILSASFQNYDFLTATGDAGTYRWAIQNPLNSTSMLVVDHGLVQTGTAIAGIAVAITVDTLAGAEQHIVSQILNSLATVNSPGPIYVPPGFQLRGYTQNLSGSTVLLIASVAYHWVPL